jgi:hypothetical protein
MGLVGWILFNPIFRQDFGEFFLFNGGYIDHNLEIQGKFFSAKTINEDYDFRFTKLK